MSNQGKYYDTIEKSIKRAAKQCDISEDTADIILAWLEFAYNNPSAFDPSVVLTRTSLIDDSINISEVELDLENAD